VGNRLTAEMFRYGLPLTLTFLAFIVVGLADRFLIGWLLGSAAVAPYAAAYDLVQQLIGAIMSVLFLAAFPMVVQLLEEEGDESARMRLRALGRALIGIGLPAAVGLGALSTEISEVLFGVAYQHDATKIMPWLAGAIFIGCIKSFYLDVVFQLRHATKYQGYIAALMAAVNVALNILLLPRYGVIGAAWATVAAFLIGALVSWRIGSTVFSLPSLRLDFFKCVSASAFMVIPMFFLPHVHGIVWLLIKIALGITTYSAIGWLLDAAGFRSLFKILCARFAAGWAAVEEKRI
jgi:O-antigen/teichoic acid export membrane protein